MEINDEYIDKLSEAVDQKDTEGVLSLLTNLHPADIAELINDLEPTKRCWIALCKRRRSF